MRHPMAVFFIIFPLLFINNIFAEDNNTIDLNQTAMLSNSPSTPTITVEPTPTFSTTYWQLVKLFDEDIYAENMHRETYILFSPLLNTHGEFKGATGCNDVLGKYSAHYFQLSFDVEHIAMTRLACPDTSIEDEFLKALKQTKSWRIKEDKLIFFDANQSALATFKTQNKNQKIKK